MARKLWLAPLLAGVVVALGVACGGDSDSPTSTPAASGGSATAEPGATTASSPTVAPTTTEVTPTATSVPATATTAPTATQAPTDTPTATPEPPTATPEPPTATPVPPTATTAPPTARPGGGPGGGGPGGGPGGRGSAYLTAKSLKFSPTTLYASSGNVSITLSNQDNFVPHNVSVTGLGTSATCTGPCTVTLSFTASAGSYSFLCTIHPYMTGTLVVQ